MMITKSVENLKQIVKQLKLFLNQVLGEIPWKLLVPIRFALSISATRPQSPFPLTFLTPPLNVPTITLSPPTTS